MERPTDKRTLVDIFAVGRRIAYRPKELIYRLGDVPSGVYFIESGLVKLYTLNSKADESILAVLRHGETFFINWALTGRAGQIYIAAMTNVSLLRVTKQTFLDACRDDSQVAMEALREMSDQMLLLVDHLNNLDFRGAHERIICQLLYLARRHGKPLHAGALTIDSINALHSNIAGSTSLARETVTRELKVLENSGIIQRSRRSIIIPDIRSLAARVELEWPLG